MKLFKKKEKEDDSNEGIKKAEYNIIIKEKLGDTTRTIRSFNAYRYVDDENKVVLLKNDKTKFEEIFPEEIKDFNEYDQKKIKAKLTELKQQLNKEMIVDTEEVNDKDIEEQVRHLEAIIRGFKYKKGSYITFSKDGQPEFTYLREGSEFHAYRWDSDTKTIYTPSDNKKKSAILSLRNKELKYTSKKIVEVSTIILLIVGLILTGINLYGGFKIWQYYDSSNIGQLEQNALETLDYCSSVLVQNGEIIRGIAQDLGTSYFERNTTVVEIPDHLKTR